MAQFAPAYALTMTNEGGYANDPNDKGGETWRGVARHDWPQWPGWQLVDAVTRSSPRAEWNHALASSAELNALVLTFYEHNYWIPLQLDALQCQQTANQLFDVAVNMGVGTAAKFLQEAINAFHHPPVAVDGRIGPLTMGAANQLVHQNLYNQINQLRRARYQQIVANTPTDARFERAWLSRIKPFGPDADGQTA